ncbi:ABC transporter permease [Thermobifida cellulosilytica]|uniref:ABC transporter permease n=1 Tax=Thermobifida cellulosilytica TB100 TaxID=665004 RepID=A0A147KIF9_THECS|nr:ABC transporter permease [Thermobifida cellulosilytica]KUP97077.1 ABC transporter permease [Thermobifida cellulosilytica TB100]
MSAATEVRTGPADGGPGNRLDNNSTRGRFPTRTPALVRSLGLRTLSVGGLLLLWWAVARAEIWPPVILPPPQAVWEKAVATTTEGFSGHTLPEHLWASMRRILVGSGYGTLGGVLIGLLIGLVPAVRALLGPFISFVRTLPPLAYLSLLVIWFGINEEPKIWLLVIASLPPVAVATADAVRNVAPDYLNAARSLGARSWQLPLWVVLPHALPEVMTSIRIAVGVAYTSVVAAETVNGIPGIGGMIREAQRYNQTDVVILGLIVIGLSGLVIDWLLQCADRVLAPWRGRT